MGDREPPRHVQIAYEYGLIYPGWTIKDYIMHAAITPDGYETIVVDGVQRAGKSNLSLQISSWAKAATIIMEINEVSLVDYLNAISQGVRPSIYLSSQPLKPTEEALWVKVLEDVCFKGGEFVARLNAVPDYEPIDSMVWDDINGHYQNTMFRINPEEYAQVDAAFTVIGTKARVIVTNIPNITRLAKNIKDNVTFEIFVGRNKKRMMKRIFRLPGLRQMNMNLFKVDIEPPSVFDIYKIPKWAWDIYEEKRVGMARDVFLALGQLVDQEQAPEGYITVKDAVIAAKDKGLNWGVSTVQQNASRGLWGKLKVNGQLYIEEESYTNLMEAELYTPND